MAHEYHPTYPAVGEVFELTLDGDAPENQPLEMVRRRGYSRFKEWRYIGKKLVGTQTRRFKLVSVGYCFTPGELTRKLANHGTIPEGQWREALKAAYQHDGKGSVGIADSSWVNSSGHVYFPYIDVNGYLFFFWSDYEFIVSWRWLVGVEE